MQRYNEILEHFSKPLMSLISDYDVNDDGVLMVSQETVQFYKYIDYTVQAEYLASCIEKTIYTDFKKELLYLTNYDQTKRELSQIIDMPDQQIDLFIRVTTQNNGRLSQSKRTTHFKMLTDEEIKMLEDIVQKNLLDKTE
jgi:transposase-like protein